MLRNGALLVLLLATTLMSFAQGTGVAEGSRADRQSETGAPRGKAVAYVIPVHEQIAKPTFYIIRRGLKEAIEHKADLVILDMKTPGGELGVTFEIMEALS